jgi:ECF sigma factor
MTMSTDVAGSVTVMIRALRHGDRSQVPTLWDRYFERLTRVAQPILRFGRCAAAGDEEDAALSAINEFCNVIAKGKLPYVDGREVLWGTLAKITERKAMKLARRFRREVSFEDLPPWSSTGCGASRIARVEPTTAYVALVKLVLAELLDTIKDPLWRQAVVLLNEGHTVPEIAHRVGRCRETVYIWFRAIGIMWEEHLDGKNLLD